MASVKFLDVFKNHLTDEQCEITKNALLINCTVSDERALNIKLYTDNYISFSKIEEIKARLTEELTLSNISIECFFAPEAFCDEAGADIVDKIKQKNALLNGYFKDAEFSLEGFSLNITLKYGGYEIIKAADFEHKFNDILYDMFKMKFEIEFDGQLENIELAPPVKEIPIRKKSEAVDTKTEDKKYDYKPADGLPIYLESAKLFYGRRIDTNVKPLINIAPPEYAEGSVYVCAWGEVFGVEMRDVTTKRGDKKVSIKFAFSDTTNSFNANIFADADKKASLKPLKDGAYVIVNGDYRYDRWSGEFVVDVKNIATVKKYEETDDYEGLRRVELHCHTNMSASDGVVSAGDIINQAYRWGHKAVAITDHGVVQAYPDAAAAVSSIRKSGGEFKVIYGVEAYFADDTRGVTDLTKLSRYHQIMLVKNLTGLKNLYKIVSSAHLDNFYHTPVSLKSVIDEHREGILLGSACEAGELYDAILKGASHEELIRIASYYDFLEIQPLGNNEFMIRESGKVYTDKRSGQVKENPYEKVTNAEVIKNFNRKVVELADELGLPVVATGDVHFLKKEDAIIRKIIQSKKYADFDNQAPLYFKTTKEMLDDFSYFGERAYEFVVENPNKIADMISDDVVPVPPGNYPPVIEGSDELLRQICWDRAMSMYGYEGKIPEIVSKRLEKELNGIISNGFSIMYVTAQKLVSYSEEHGFLVGSRGSVGSSFVATMAGISEVNPIAPHYYCPNCKYNEFFTKGEVGSGFDLPEKDCPKCGTRYKRDGHDIPFETFLGFKGDKVPDIDLNFSNEFQSAVQKYTEELFGKENVFKAGTISTIAEKTAYGLAKNYAEMKNIVLSSAELNRLAGKVERAKIKVTTGQHPAGMVVVPRDKEIYDFCPVQHPADDVKSDIVTTHFDFHSIHDTILKLDELGHVVPTTYKYLEEYSGVPVSEVSMSDPDVYSLFLSPKALGVTEEQIKTHTGTYCIPEFGTKFVMEMLRDCKPKNFADLLQISGLSHGTDVYLGNAKDLIEKGICTISEVIGTRDNIMVYLIHQGMEEGRAFKITETVRKGLVAKGKVSPDEWKAMEDDMRAVGVPDWYIESCHKIKYMFPKAHAAAYVISALRLAWYKVHYPLEFYCAYFTARPEDVDVPTLLKGKEGVKAYLKMIEDKGKEASQKEQDVYGNMLIFNEIFERGIEILPIDLKRSHATKYVPENGKIRLPFGSLSGVGDKAAIALYETAQKGDFISKEEFGSQAGVSKTIIEALSDMGVLSELPDTNQISMF